VTAPSSNVQPGSRATAAAWAAGAGQLAEWTWERLVNRVDVWGAYRRPEDIAKKIVLEDGTKVVLGSQTTRPALPRRGQVFLTRGVLARHFAGRYRSDILGLHSTSSDNLCRWGGLDLDRHGETGNPPEANLRAALAWHDDLVHRGFRPLLTDSNGKGGFHLLTIFNEPVLTRRVFFFLKSLVADHSKYGMPASPETFPKQVAVASPGQPGQFGNWLRLPGKHHTRDHWSRVWDGSRWLDGAAAVEFILALTGDPPDLVPKVPPPEPVCPVRIHVPHRHEGGDNLARRIAAYLAKLPTGLGEGTGRDDIAYGFAAFLTRDLDLSDEIARAWLERWDRLNLVPKGTAALAEILANARKYARNPVGCGLSLPPPSGRGGHRPITFRAEMGVPR
jgi:hypothetical protein